MCPAAEKQMKEFGKVQRRFKQSEVKCNCCVHQAAFAEWDKKYCEDGCVRANYPLWLRELWDLVGYCMKPAAPGMSSLMLLDTSEFAEWLSSIDIDRKANLEDFEDLFNLAQELLMKWQEYDKEVVWNKKDYEELIRYGH